MARRLAALLLLGGAAGSPGALNDAPGAAAREGLAAEDAEACAEGGACALSLLQRRRVGTQGGRDARGARAGRDAAGRDAAAAPDAAGAAGPPEEGPADAGSALRSLEARVLAEGGPQAERFKEAVLKLQASVGPAPRGPCGLGPAGPAGPALLGSAAAARGASEPGERVPDAGQIAGLFTFGSPGTCMSPLRNPLRADGVFPGQRVFTERVERILGMPFRFHDPVSFVANLVGLSHPVMDALAVDVGGGGAPEFLASSGSGSLAAWPVEDLSFWINGHEIRTYIRYLKAYAQPFNVRSYQMAVLASAVYPNRNPTLADVAGAAGVVGWNVVARSKPAPLMGEIDSVKEVIVADQATLFQEPTSLACAIAFVGTHDITQWVVDLNFVSSEYCGINGVHEGFRNQLQRVTNAPDFSASLQPALASCKDLYVVGHSLGAAQAELYAACIQRAPKMGEAGWEDYQFIAWTPSATPKLLPAMV